MARYKIISFDGGGIKGLFTATLLDRLARAHPKLVQNVDLLAGTSTGGIIALALAAGKTPAELVALYRDEAGTIFDDSVWDDIIDLGKAVGADYNHRGLKRVLRRELGTKKLSQLGKRVLIPTFDLDAPARPPRPRMWKPKFFHNFPGPDSDGGELAVDVALRTSSAPTYFPSYQGYVDGGVVANNPSMAALTQALDTRAVGCRQQDILLLSVGTGSEPKFIKRKRVDWGWGQWARPLVSMMISGVMGVADYHCRQILGKRYHRIDTYLDRGVDLDDTEPEMLDYLVTAAEGLDLSDALDWLKRHRW